MRPPLNLLQTFVAFARTASVARCAAQLHLTQPAVSKRIATLEEQLDVRLFDRVGRRISLTEAGRVLLPNARKIIADVQASRRQLADLSGDIGGELQLATSHHIGLHRLPPVLRAFANDHPNVDLQLSFWDSEKAYAEVLQGKVDMAVITLSPDTHPKLHSQIIWQDTLAFVSSPAHPLAKKRRLRLKDLADFPAILPEPATYTGRIVASLFAERDLRLPLKLATNYLETIKMMVSIDLGWSVLPESLIDQQLQILPVEKLKLQRQLGYLHHRERSLSNAAHAFIRQLSQASPIKA